MTQKQHSTLNAIDPTGTEQHMTLQLSAESKSELDEKLTTLRSKKEEWATLSIRKKRKLLDHLRVGTLAVAERQVQAAAAAKGFSPDDLVASEEWLAGPLITLRNLRLLADSLDDMIAGKKPQLPDGAIQTRADGKTIAKVFPCGTYDKLMYAGFKGEIWMQDGVKAEDVISTQAVFYDEKAPEGAVALVLGAGNVSSIGPLDVIYKLYVEGQVCILKMNPVNEYLGEFIEESFKVLIDAGYLELAYGGADVGAYLCQHVDVEEIHITGSDRTHDAIVYGVGKDGAKRKKSDERLIKKRITSELGNVSPIIVIPGNWSAKELKFQSENIATQLANNGGFNCNAARVLITHKSWPQREQFLTELRDTFTKIHKRVAYYPGAEDRLASFCAQNPDKVEQFGTQSGEILPWTFISDIDPKNTENICFTTEAFAGVMAETAIEAGTVEAFLEHAVTFCNQTVWGTLSAEIIVDPKTEKERADIIDQAIADLRYGSIVVNHWPALAYGLGATTWGAFPGHTFQDIKSGIGVVHNTFMFDRPEKTVIRGPFKVTPTPPWFVTNKNALNIAKRLVEFEANPSVLKLGKIVAASLKG